MTKQEKIKHAWEILIGKIGYSIRKDKIDENGYLRYETPNNLSVLHELCEKHPSRSDWEKWRPKSLQGIENNNGWMKISENGYPKSQGRYQCYHKEEYETERYFYPDGIFTDKNEFGGFDSEILDQKSITHWRNIDRSKPLY